MTCCSAASDHTPGGRAANAAFTLLLLIFVKVRFDRLHRRIHSLNKKLDDQRDFWLAKLQAFEQRVGPRLTK